MHGLRSCSVSLLAAVAVCWFLHDAFFMWFFYVPLMFCLDFFAHRLRALRQDNRYVYGIRLLIWCIALAALFPLDTYLEKAARRDADAVLAAANAYNARNGHYPERLADIGFDEEALKKRWRLRYSSLEGTSADIYYSSRFVPFDQYSYDFGSREWKFTPD